MTSTPTGPALVQPRLRHLALTLALIAMAACRGEPAGPAAEAPSGTQAPVTAEEPAEAVNPATPAEAEGPALDLPAGQTLGDALPPLPLPAPRLGSGAGGEVGVAYPPASCDDLAPEGYNLAKQLSFSVPPATAGDPPGVLDVCLHQKLLDRKDRAGRGGRQFVAIAAWPDGQVQTADFAEFSRPPTNLPAERARAGHDAAAWGTLVATGHARLPVLAVVSGRFYDGTLGDEVHYLREARLLRVPAKSADKGAAPAWQPFERRAFGTVDLAHLEALCEGRSEAGPGPPLAAACARRDKLTSTQAEAAAGRLAGREKRLAGQADDGAKAATDADPQSIWLREGRKALRKGDATAAIEAALRVDAVCGEAVAEAHSLIGDALVVLDLKAVKVRPAQTTAPLCEPLPDKPAPRRSKPEPARPEPAKAEAGKGDAKDETKPAQARPSGRAQE